MVVDSKTSSDATHGTSSASQRGEHIGTRQLQAPTQLMAAGNFELLDSPMTACGILQVLLSAGSKQASKMESLDTKIIKASVKHDKLYERFFNHTSTYLLGNKLI